MVVTIPPSATTPWKATANSGRFGLKIAKTSPLRTPRRRQSAADPANFGGELAIGQRPPGEPVDDRGLVAALDRAGEYEGRQRLLRNAHVGIRARDHHRSSSWTLAPSWGRW